MRREIVFNVAVMALVCFGLGYVLVDGCDSVTGWNKSEYGVPNAGPPVDVSEASSVPGPLVVKSSEITYMDEAGGGSAACLSAGGGAGGGLDAFGGSGGVGGGR